MCSVAHNENALGSGYAAYFGPFAVVWVDQSRNPAAPTEKS